MNYETNKEFSLDSEGFYRSILRITYTPIKKVTWTNIHRKKGDVIYKRNLFTLFRKKVKEVVQEDVIREYGFDANRFIIIGNGPKKAIEDGVVGDNQNYRTTDL